MSAKGLRNQTEQKCHDGAGYVHRTELYTEMYRDQELHHGQKRT